MANCFASLASCIAHVREKFPIASLSESLDVDTGTPTGESFPRWLFRGERSCYPKCVSSFRRLQEDTKVPDTVKGDLAAITEFVVRYTVDYLILPYTADLDHWTDIEHFTKSTVYEALAFVQHYGLPTAFIDFTDDLDIASSFAAQGAPATLARIAVLDAAHAAKFGMIIDFQDFAATRAARQRAYGVYLNGQQDLCGETAREYVEWLCCTLRPEDLSNWGVRLPFLLDTQQDRLAGWVRHAVNMYVMQHGPFNPMTAAWILDRIPIVPLVGNHDGHEGIDFHPPETITFDPRDERTLSLEGWTNATPIDATEGSLPEGHRYECINPARGLVRFLGT